MLLSFQVRFHTELTNLTFFENVFLVQEKKQSSRLDNSLQVSAKVDCRRPSGPMPLIRPRTVQAKPTEKKTNYRDLKTPFMNRQAYSGLIKHNQGSFRKN